MASDLEARTGMLYGSLLAGHRVRQLRRLRRAALQFAVGAATHTSHGLGTGLLLPYVMEFNRPARTGRDRRARRADGRATPSSASTPSAARSASRPPSPRSASPRRTSAAMAEASVGIKRLIDNNPRPLDVDALERSSKPPGTATRRSRLRPERGVVDRLAGAA